MNLLIGEKDAADIEPLINWDDMLGRGTSRCVYSMKTCNDYVVKVECDETLANINEFNVWKSASGDQKSNLASIVAWSSCFKYMIMERMHSASDVDDISSKIFNMNLPSNVTDKCPGNFGVDSHGKLKMLDYALTKDSGNSYESPFV